MIKLIYIFTVVGCIGPLFSFTQSQSLVTDNVILLYFSWIVMDNYTFYVNLWT